MTAWYLAAMNITEPWVSTLQMLCQALTAAPCSCCLLQGLSALSFVLSKWKTCSMVLRSGERLEIYSVSLPWEALGCGNVLSHYPSVQCYWLCGIWLNVSRYYSPTHVRIHPAASISSDITNEHKRANSTGSHTGPCHNTASPMFDRWRGMLWLMSHFFPSPHFSLLISMVQVYLSLICPKNLGPELGSHFQAKSNLACLFFTVTGGLHFVVCPLYLDPWMNWRWHTYLLLTWVDVMKGFFFIKDRILRSSTSDVFCGF